MKLMLLPLFLFCFINLNAQNLVPNSSFEESFSCPLQYNQLWRAMPWFRPTEGTSDYFNACDTLHINGQINAGVPNNFFGYQEARSGQAYTGICLNTNSNSYREYLEIKLTEPLVAETKYNVSFYYSAADSAKMAVKSVGAYFTPDSLLHSGYRNFPVTPQVSYHGGFISDTNRWMLFSKSFIASGGENYLVIGNFNDQSKTEKTYLSGITSATFDLAYIYVDDVSVSEDTLKIAAEDTAISDVVSADLFNVGPSPTMGEVIISYFPNDQFSEVDFSVYNLFGKEMFQSNLHAGKTVLQTEKWSAGYYFFQARNEHLQKEGRFLLVR